MAERSLIEERLSRSDAAERLRTPADGLDDGENGKGTESEAKR